MESVDLDANSASLSISGSVKNEFGNGLKNIAVIAKGTTQGSNTSENGRFSLLLSRSTKSLVIDHKDVKKIALLYIDLVSMNLSDLSFTLSN